ncbi:FAD-dependent monooxygenase [Thiomicrorhabdus aquaedulcis]|uniref:FAD-dependent monooxygenase n=1 Tax=Thiomicrorhabdus aquaedulcis TaxID=2211106 RepID=UPI001E395532|nr:FAD-dependent monooxygenase [Thiomicrorhabdus aquaedulcis]
MMHAQDTNNKAINDSAASFDVVVVGGGMVGSVLALGLGQQGFKVLLLEKQAVTTDWHASLPLQPRVSALTRASENILRNLGAWGGIEARRCHAFGAMHVWDEASVGQVHFSAADVGEANLGHVVENDVVQAALWEQLKGCEYVHIALNQALESLEFKDDQAWLTLDGLGKVVTPLIVGADGAFSKVRALAHIGLDTHDYQQCAVVGCVKTELSHQDTCWQRYQAAGPFAYLAMGNNMSSIAWYLPTHKMAWALSLSDEELARNIEIASDHRLGKVLEVGQRIAFALVRRHALHYVKPNLALVGDAAHTIHPQAGQGVNLGLLDAAVLLDVIVEAKAHGKSWGNFAVLRQYERARRGDNALVQRSMEGFDWLFNQQSALKTRLLNGFLPLANRLLPVKKWLMMQALNGRDGVPRLAKPFIFNNLGDASTRVKATSCNKFDI